MHSLLSLLGDSNRIRLPFQKLVGWRDKVWKDPIAPYRYCLQSHSGRFVALLRRRPYHSRAVCLYWPRYVSVARIRTVRPVDIMTAHIPMREPRIKKETNLAPSIGPVACSCGWLGRQFITHPGTEVVLDQIGVLPSGL